MYSSVVENVRKFVSISKYFLPQKKTITSKNKFKAKSSDKLSNGFGTVKINLSGEKN
jgi:hypothetical protein